MIDFIKWCFWIGMAALAFSIAQQKFEEWKQEQYDQIRAIARSAADDALYDLSIYCGNYFNRSDPRCKAFTR